MLTMHNSYSDKSDLRRCWRSLQYPCCLRPMYHNPTSLLRASSTDGKFRGHVQLVGHDDDRCTT